MASLASQLEAVSPHHSPRFEKPHPDPVLDATPVQTTPGIAELHGTSVSPLALDDLSTIQAMIRMELQAEDDDIDGFIDDEERD